MIYATIFCDYWLLKDEKYWVRITIKGNRLFYLNDVASPETDILETKIIINSTILDKRSEARFITIYIKDHFLATIMKDSEYMQV